MLDTIGHPQLTPGTERFDRRVHARPQPAFGLESLRRRKWLLSMGMLACVTIAALFVALRPVTYTASGQLLIYIRQILTGSEQAILPGRADLAMVQNQIELLRSGYVLGKVVDALQLTKDPEFISDLQEPSGLVSGESADASATAKAEARAFRAALRAMNRKLEVRQLGTSHIVTVSFEASNPDKAARIVNSLIQIYLQERARAFDAASSRASTLREIHQNLGPSAQVVSEAEPPIKANGPPAAAILAIAALLGLSAGAAIALLLDMVDDTIRNAHQMEYALGLECLGVVPRFPGLGIGPEDSAARRLLASQNPVLRRAAAMLQEVSHGGARTIGVTSVVAGEGATTLAIGLAMAAAESGKQVLLVDAVPENPAVSRWAALAARALCEPPAAARDGIVEIQPALHVLPLDEPSGGAARLMRRGWLDDMTSTAAVSYDLVIVDMPSLVAGPQVRAAAPSLDAFLLVVKWATTQSELVRQAFESAGQARYKFIGTVLNMADDTAMKRYRSERPAATRARSAS
ncbi:MAG TPA: cellulose synthase operon protein YhjQ/BcsQ [Bosea sp. (in: a-proteobacteria)]|jgi:Mrp family chromosome partitioning ATPase|uniref:cellulose synthase operon protein YhjQ/BcsQ n=1 Tax=Bosea sp. (in: a-proteobacteria) TaxID=1871050 RepID=UPI002E0E06F6|nr:cellulose synthase operon protein YhjQ/BcsQ [Bosea sp. (in: a-proteobacteria)]